MYTINHTHNGYKVFAIPGKDLPKDIYITFSYSIGSFGFLVLLNETLTGDQWIERIQSYYGISPRINKVIQSIKQAMPNNI